MIVLIDSSTYRRWSSWHHWRDQVNNAKLDINYTGFIELYYPNSKKFIIDITDDYVDHTLEKRVRQFTFKSEIHYHWFLLDNILDQKTV